MAATDPDFRLNPRLIEFKLTNIAHLDDGDHSLLDRFTQQWSLEAFHRMLDDTRVPLGYADLRTFAIWELGWDRNSLLDLTDEEGWDIMSLFEREWMDLVEDEPCDLLVLERVRVVPEFRGNGLGPLIGGMAIKGIRSTNVDYAVCFPAPFEEYPSVTKREAVRSLGRTWAKLGFQHLNDGVWGLDLTSTAFDNALEALIADAMEKLPSAYEGD